MSNSWPDLLYKLTRNGKVEKAAIVDQHGHVIDQPVNELINISVQNEEQVMRLLRLMSVKSTNKTVIFFLNVTFRNN